MKPVIGIVEWPYLDKDQDKIYEILTPVVEWVVRSGGRPIGIFPTQIDNFIEKRIPELKSMSGVELKELKETLMMCDGIIKPGANKIYPHESKIYEIACKENMPFLGICQGMQVMRNHGVDYIPNIKNADSHKKGEDYVHSVEIDPKSRLHSIFGKNEILVNSKHSYHIPDAGNKTPVAYSKDGVIEALEDRDKLFNIGVQWHPELLDDDNTLNLFGEFVESAKVYRRKKF